MVPSGADSISLDVADYIWEEAYATPSRA